MRVGFRNSILSCILCLILTGSVRSNNNATKESFPLDSKRISLPGQWAVLGSWDTPPDSPDGQHVNYVNFPTPPQDRDVTDAELWICRSGGTDHRKIANLRTQAHDGASQRFLTNDRILYYTDGYTHIVDLDGNQLAKIEGQSKHDNTTTYFLLRGGGGFPIRRSDFEGNVRDILQTADLASWAEELPGSDDPKEWIFRHIHIAPDTENIAVQLDTGEQPWYLFTCRPDGSDLRYFGIKPMHVNWWDGDTVVGVDNLIDDGHPNDWSIRRWDRDRNVIETLAGPGNHPTISPDRRWIVTDPPYGTDPVTLIEYDLSRKTSRTVETYGTGIVWGRKIHLNPAFSHNGRRLYWNRPVDNETMEVWYYLVPES